MIDLGTQPELDITTEVLEIARRLEHAGFETWCVGGAVRDQLLNLANQDIDLATTATPDQVQSLFRRTVPIGLSHGTVAVLDRKNVTHEVTTFRRDVKTDGRHAEVEFGASLKEDLARRDFTINAIAYQPLTHEWRDPFAGLDDLRKGIVRAVGDPRQRFREDYLRILRAVRFSARFDFTIESDTLKAARELAGCLVHLSAERVRDEWFKSLQTAIAPSRVVAAWHELGALRLWLPEIRVQPTDARCAAVDAFDHRDPVVMTAQLSDDPLASLTRLKCSTAAIRRGADIGTFRDSVPLELTEVSVRRWLARVRSAAPDLLLIARATNAGAALTSLVQLVQDSHAPLSVGDLAVDGNDLIGIGIPRGPALGEVLNRLLDYVLEDPARNERELLLHQASRYER